jgi:transglycosylase-like protein with SLT domain
MLRRVLPVVAVYSLMALPGRALAWEPAAGSPPGWHPFWIETTDRVELYVTASDNTSFGQLPSGLFFRVDAPAQNGRYWVYNPLWSGWAWLPQRSIQPVPEPTEDQVSATWALFNPREYLYAQAPDLAPRLDCIIAGESGWDPAQQNMRTRAAGLAQFLPSTWATTPQGQEGLSPFEPTANIDAAIWLARTRGWQQWQVFVQGGCH